AKCGPKTDANQPVSTEPATEIPDPHAGPLLVVLSGPSGAGKDAVRDELRHRRRDHMHFAVTATTRPPRQDEQEGVHYHFLSEEAFLQLMRAGGLLEFERYDTTDRGSPRNEVEGAL